MTTEMQVLTTAPAGSPEWLEKHKGKIGSNDVATILGVGFKRRSRLRLWSELTGKLQREDISNEPQIRRGIIFEPMIALMVEAECGVKIANTPGLVQSPDLECLAVTPDGMTTGPVSGRPAVAEFKSVGMHARKDWRSDVPMRAIIQGASLMWVLRREAVLFGAFCMDSEEDLEPDEIIGKGDPLLLWAERERRPDLEDMMGNEIVAFFEQYVRRDIPPPPGDDIETVKKLFPHEVAGTMKNITAQCELDWVRCEELAGLTTAAEKEKKERKARIMLELGDAEFGKTPGGVILRARAEPRNVKAYSCAPRVLRRVTKTGA